MTREQLPLTEKGNESSNSGRGVEQVEGNEVRKGLMLLSTWRHSLRSSAGEGGVGSGVGNGKC